MAHGNPARIPTSLALLLTLVGTRLGGQATPPPPEVPSTTPPLCQLLIHRVGIEPGKPWNDHAVAKVTAEIEALGLTGETLHFECRLRTPQRDVVRTRVATPCSLGRPTAASRETASPAPSAPVLGELGGRVVEAAGREARLELPEPYVPRVGDRAEFLRVIGDREAAEVVGRGRVTYAEGDEVRAVVGEGDPAPRIGLAVIVRSALPAGVISSIGYPQGIFGREARPDLDTAAQVSHMMDESKRRAQAEVEARQSHQKAQEYLGAGAFQRAANALRRAADVDHPRSALELFKMYEAGRPGAPAADEAVRRLRRAAELGHAEAQGRLALAYERGTDGLSRDPEKAAAGTVPKNR